MCRVLIVDDHAMVRQGIATMLHTDPNILVVAEAQDGSEATEAVARHQPDVVLLDVNMPVLNGPETTRRIRDQWPHVQVVGLSVQDDEATARLMLDAGACAFISKSADAGELIAAVLGNASYEN
jgi:DNA-binding NarL/FixJ family response regulator